MEYSLNQTVVFYGEEMLRGRLTDEEFAAVDGKKVTGKITGHFSDNFIVKLDRKLSNGETTVLVHSDACKPLACHWCMDAHKVPQTPFTMPQYESNTFPMMPCKECRREEYLAWVEAQAVCA